MGHRYFEIAFSPAVRAAQDRHGSRSTLAKAETGEPHHDRLGARETDFVRARDSFYFATVGATGWPHVQHRGGAPGFLRVLGDRTIGFADFGGNRQYISVGNLETNDKVSLFLMDYGNRMRLKIFGRARVLDDNDPLIAAVLAAPGYPTAVERGVVIAIEAFDWNCSKHITPRFPADEIARATAPLHRRIADLDARLAKT